MEIDEFDVQDKISKLVQKRHLELSEIKKYFDINNIQPYKNIALIGQHLKLFEVIYSKEIYKQKCENIISITLSIGKIMDLNNSIKTILLSLKIFKEHKNYLQNLYMNDKKNFITEMFEKNNSIPLSQNNFIKERISSNSEKDVSFKKMQKFYESLYGNDSNFFNDLNDYYTFDNISNNKENENDKNEIENEDSNKKLIKIISNSYANLNKFYSRMSLSIETDYPSIIFSACDVFHMLYNKMMDNICYYFIKPCSNDLIKLSEVVIKKEISEFNSSLIKFYGL